MSASRRNTMVFLACIALLLSNSARAQARRAAPPPRPLRSFSVTPYLGVGFQNRYYDGVVRFSDGSTALLTFDPGSDVVLGVQGGYRFQPKLSALVNLATSSPGARYVEDGSLRPDVGLTTMQLDAGLLYDLRTFPVGGKAAPFSVGGGLSLTFHSLSRFTWNGNIVEPGTTSVGIHGLAALDIAAHAASEFPRADEIDSWLAGPRRSPEQDRLGGRQARGDPGWRHVHISRDLGGRYHPAITPRLTFQSS